jgi:hypothetical protein
MFYLFDIVFVYFSRCVHVHKFRVRFNSDLFLWGRLPLRFLKNKDRKLDQTFNSSFCYIDGVLLLNNYRFGPHKNKSVSYGAQFVPIGIPIVCWNTHPSKRTNMLSINKSNIWKVSSCLYLNIHYYWHLCSIMVSYKQKGP